MKSGRFYLDYLRHRLTANTRHGTHSPFVYRLVDEVIYARRQPAEPKDRAARLLIRLVDYFKPRHVYELGSGKPPDSLDFILAGGVDAERIVVQLEMLWPKIHSGSVLVLTDIYHNMQMKELWKSIKIRREVTVTIDLFRMGLVFFHAEQAREDFKIRY